MHDLSGQPGHSYYPIIPVFRALFIMDGSGAGVMIDGDVMRHCIEWIHYSKIIYIWGLYKRAISNN